MSEDDPEIQNLANEGAAFIKNEPFLKEMLYVRMGLKLLMKICLMRY